ncbi:MAG: hypothetical protein M3454_08685 [Actinomycetota bacterium]|nr:hypothetical protein [Actinomycetota bacterium]
MSGDFLGLLAEEPPGDEVPGGGLDDRAARGDGNRHEGASSRQDSPSRDPLEAAADRAGGVLTRDGEQDHQQEPELAGQDRELGSEPDGSWISSRIAGTCSHADGQHESWLRAGTTTSTGRSTGGSTPP